MNCEDVNNKLIDLCGNELSQAEAEALYAHAANCGSCNALIAETRAFFLQLENEKNTELNPYLAEKIIAKASERNTDGIFVPVFRLAAVLAIGIMTGILLNNFLQPAGDDKNPVSKNENSISAEDLLGNDNSILTLNE